MRRESGEDTVTEKTGGHAVVLGASVAGLLAARVLADHYQRVSVVERDVSPPIGSHRRGVPHGRHLHGLHSRGRRVLEELFEGFTAEMVADGAVTSDVLANTRWQLSGYQLRRAEVGLTGLFSSRPFLEGHIRTRVAALPNVHILEHTDVVSLRAEAGRVTGVRIMPREAGEPGQTLDADLVVDATGRGSRTPLWLEQLGYDRPPVDRLEIGVSYATRTYRLRPGAMGEVSLIVCNATPDNPRSGVMAAVEGHRYILTLVARNGEPAPLDPAAFEEFAAALPFPDIAEAIRDGEPLDSPVPFKFPASVRHRYERLRRLPAGLLVTGDAVCSFNPVYGQGMTVAALEAEVLGRLLSAGGAPQPQRWFAEIAKVVNGPWDGATGADLADPLVPGKRTAKVRLINAYLTRLHAAASTDASLARALIRVLSMTDRPEGLLRPDRMARVLLRRRPASTATTADAPALAGRR
jgi:2-polyprenyl-6-methoxyphenol hydroxylase-like FAD-dependent oxidoreductase